MANTGVNQVMKVAAEAAYGTTPATPEYVELGLVTGGNVGIKTSVVETYGIGAAAAQASMMGKVEGSLRAEITNPSADVLNQAITRTNGVLSSYSFVVGDKDGAWNGAGLKWNTLELESDSDNPLKASMEGIYQWIFDADATVDAHDSGTIKIWQPEGRELQLPSGSQNALSDLLTVRISVRNNLTGYGVGGSAAAEDNLARAIKGIREGNFEVEATITAYDAPSAAAVEGIFAKCPSSGAFNMVLVFTELCGATPGTLTITCYGGVYTSMEQPIKPNDYVDFSYTIRFRGDDTHDPIVIAEA